MKTIPEQIRAIYMRSLSGEISALEQQQLNDFFRTATISDIEELIEGQVGRAPGGKVEDEEVRIQAVRKSLLLRTRNSERSHPLRILPLLVTAAAVIVAALGIWLFLSQQRRELSTLPTDMLTISSLPAGKAHMQTQLGGRTTVSVPNGSQYSIVLPDGSTVQLNAGSTISYDTRFEGQLRKVTLEGEAFFIVAKNRTRPFIVTTKDQSVTVLGTQFNVRSYKADHGTVTTLREGRVSVADTKGNSLILSPGQQSTSKPGGLTAKATTVEDVVSWTERRLSFTDAPLSEVLATASRWYNIDLEFEGEMNTELYTGQLKKDASLGSFMRILEANGFGYKITENRLTIFRNNR